MARRLDLSWLKPPTVPADGVMSLADHLRELRWRLVASLAVVVAGMIFSAFFYNDLMRVVLYPLQVASATLAETTPGLDLRYTLQDVLNPFMLWLKVAGVGGLLLTCPFWLYQAWAYIAPALIAKEKKYAFMFLGAAVPLFLFGVVVAYLVLPQGIIVMLQFTPSETIQVENLLTIDGFLTLLLQMMLVFGLGFLVPVFVVAANLMGLVTGEQLRKARTVVIFLSFVFGAAATPGGDPFSMLALAIPMSLLFLLAEFICHKNDKRRAKRQARELARP